MQAHQYWNTQISNFCINNLGPHQLHVHNKNVDANQEEDEKKTSFNRIDAFSTYISYQIASSQNEKKILIDLFKKDIQYIQQNEPQALWQKHIDVVHGILDILALVTSSTVQNTPLKKLQSTIASRQQEKNQALNKSLLSFLLSPTNFHNWYQA
ncbi:hypothetical protein [Parachlamydia acanthamoebae]|uniref:hypothetical protein n=1 Tax=Parachlamydia acanthamoebae TaxID=83552 RepID=UPI000751426C|nr:hypothetical protein [Parachlamydia acanthamoebae]